MPSLTSLTCDILLVASNEYLCMLLSGGYNRKSVHAPLTDHMITDAIGSLTDILVAVGPLMFIDK